MNSSTKERLLFVVAVNQTELEKQPTLQAFQTQIAQNNATLIDQIKQSIQQETALAGRVELLALDNYLNLFAGVVEVDSVVIQPAPHEKPDWHMDNSFIQLLLTTIFSWRTDAGAPRQSIWATPLSYHLSHQSLDKSDVTWSFLRLNELCAESDNISLLFGMKGIGSRG